MVSMINLILTFLILGWFLIWVIIKSSLGVFLPIPAFFQFDFKLSNSMASYYKMFLIFSLILLIFTPT